MLSSLCFPDSSKSCFACCPPIRPAGYDHLDYRNIIKRHLLENRSDFKPEDIDLRPITGFSCWALGYIDRKFRQPGCLLHPLQNNGKDLRYRIDYGSKCIREGCPEAKIFECLNSEQKKFWMNLAYGLDSFEYSSRKTNSLFNILGWGYETLAILADNDMTDFQDEFMFFKTYPFFRSDIAPRGHAYLLNRIVKKKGPEILKREAFEVSFRYFSKEIFHGINERFVKEERPEYIHKMDVDPLFADLLRLGLQIKKSEYSTVVKIKEFTDKRLNRLLRIL